MSSQCITSNALIISKDTKVGARKVRALTAHANSPMCPKARFHTNKHGGGAIWVNLNQTELMTHPQLRARPPLVPTPIKGVLLKALPNH